MSRPLAVAVFEHSPYCCHEARTLRLAYTRWRRKAPVGPLPVWVYVAPGRQAEVLWRLCAGVNLGSRLNTQRMFWEDLQPSAVAFHILLHSCGSAATNTTIDPLSHSHWLLPSAFLFSLSLLGSACVCVMSARLRNTLQSGHRSPDVVSEVLMCYTCTVYPLDFFNAFALCFNLFFFSSFYL